MTPTPPNLRALLDSVRIGILSVDAKGRVRYQNGEASRILGVSAAATYGRDLADFLGAAHPVVTLIADVLQGEREQAKNACTLPDRLGERQQRVDLTATPISPTAGRDLDGTGEGADAVDSGVVLTLRDRTIELELESLVAQRASDELFEQLAAGIAHEIRNPLSGIHGAAELLEQKLGEDRLRRYPEIIRSETRRIRRLLDDLGQLTRGGEMCPERVNLHKILDDLLILQQPSSLFSGLQIVREYDPSIPELEMDPDRVSQIFLNLMRNAAQAMKGSGRLTVRTRIEALFQLAHGEGERRHLVRIDIEDTGPGIADEDLPHIFTPFFTRREGGSGLGLAMVQHWVVRHGGRIRAHKAHAGGTQMRVHLPVTLSNGRQS